MSDINTIIQAVKTQFENYSGLDYMRSITAYADEYALEDAGKVPYINIDIQDFRIEEASNQSLHHYERRIYPLIILFSCRHKQKVEVKKGTGSFKGIFDIYEDVRSAIYSDVTFSNAVNKFPPRMAFASDVSKHPNGDFWYGRAAIFYDVFKDVYIKDKLGG